MIQINTYLYILQLQNTTYLDRVCLFSTVCEAAFGGLDDGLSRQAALTRLHSCENAEILLRFTTPLCEVRISITQQQQFRWRP